METKMEFRPMTPDDYEPVRQFLSEMGWHHRVADPEKFNAMIEKTSRAVVAVDGSRIVGFARALCDEVCNGYISMVGVAAQISVGKASVASLCDNSCERMPESPGFYVRGAGAADFGREWDSGPQRSRWKEFELESRSDRTKPCS